MDQTGSTFNSRRKKIKDFLYLFKGQERIHSKMSSDQMQKHIEERGVRIQGLAKAGRDKAAIP